MIDPDTYGKYLEAEQQAKQWGVSLAEVLDRRRLLMTQKRKHDVEIDALEELLRRLDRQSPNKIMSFYMGRPDGSAMEMFEAMKMWLETVIRNRANRTLGDL